MRLIRAIELLRGVDGEIVFDIYGPLEDSIYWRKCRQQMQSLPGTIRVSYRGEASHDQVDGLLRGYHLLLLPTKGENFGHVIQEALAAGCPVAVSDRTPWHWVELVGAGWDLPLDEEDRWRRALREIVDADRGRFDQMSKAAAHLARNCSPRRRPSPRIDGCSSSLFAARLRHPIAFQVGTGTPRAPNGRRCDSPPSGPAGTQGNAGAFSPQKPASKAHRFPDVG